MVNKQRQIDTFNIKHPFCSLLGITVPRSPLTSRAENRDRPFCQTGHSQPVSPGKADLPQAFPRMVASCFHESKSIFSRVYRFHWVPSIGGHSESRGLQPVWCEYLWERGLVHQRTQKRMVGIKPLRVQLCRLPVGALGSVLPLLTLAVQPLHRRLI